MIRGKQRAKQKLILTTAVGHKSFSAFGTGHVYLLYSSFHWLVVLFTPALIDHSGYIDIVFTTLNENCCSNLVS